MVFRTILKFEDPKFYYHLLKQPPIPKQFSFQRYFPVQSGPGREAPSCNGIPKFFEEPFLLSLLHPYTASAGITSPHGLNASFYRARDNQFSCTGEDITQSKIIQPQRTFKMKWYSRCQVLEWSTELGMKRSIMMSILPLLCWSSLMLAPIH